MRELQADAGAKLEELRQGQQLLFWLEPIAIGALLIQAWAMVEVFDVGRGYLAAALSATVATVGLCWALVARRRVHALSAELGESLDD